MAVAANGRDQPLASAFVASTLSKDALRQIEDARPASLGLERCRYHDGCHNDVHEAVPAMPVILAMKASNENTGVSVPRGTTAPSAVAAGLRHAEHRAAD